MTVDATATGNGAQRPAAKTWQRRVGRGGGAPVGMCWLTDSFAFFRHGDVSSFTAVQPCGRAVPCQLVD